MGAIFVHSTALVESEDIGENARIWAFVHVQKGARIGTNCNIGDHCFIEAGAVIGDNVTIKNQNMLPEGLLVEDGAFIGPHVSFTNDLHPRSPRMPQVAKRYSDHRWLLRCVVGRGATLGAGAVILPGITIGDYAMVGAGAVVSRDVPPYAVMLGNPARQIGFVCQCGQSLQLVGGSGSCLRCGMTYVRSETTIEPAEAPARSLSA